MGLDFTARPGPFIWAQSILLGEFPDPARPVHTTIGQ